MVRRLTEQVKSLALQDVYGRMVRLLMELSDVVGEERVVREKLTQQDIADRVGSSRDGQPRHEGPDDRRLRCRARRTPRHPQEAAGGALTGKPARFQASPAKTTTNIEAAAMQRVALTRALGRSS